MDTLKIRGCLKLIFEFQPLFCFVYNIPRISSHSFRPLAVGILTGWISKNSLRSVAFGDLSMPSLSYTSCKVCWISVVNILSPIWIMPCNSWRILFLVFMIWISLKQFLLLIIQSFNPVNAQSLIIIPQFWIFAFQCWHCEIDNQLAWHDIHSMPASCLQMAPFWLDVFNCSW